MWTGAGVGTSCYEALERLKPSLVVAPDRVVALAKVRGAAAAAAYASEIARCRRDQGAAKRREER